MKYFRSVCVPAIFGAAIACGKDVDLGGSAEAGLPAADNCDPCATAADCQPTSTCGRIGGDTFCATLCANGAPCAAGETCRATPNASGAEMPACVPTSGICAPAPPPAGSDAGACGVLAGPSIVAACHSCGRFSDDCQPNGCYGGWWCSTTTRRCERPPRSCP